MNYIYIYIVIICYNVVYGKIVCCREHCNTVHLEDNGSRGIDSTNVVRIMKHPSS